MSIKVTRGDTTVEVSTEDELRMVFSILGETRIRGVSLNPKGFVASVDTLVEVFESIPSYSKSNKALRALKQNPNGMTTQELVRELGLDKEQALGGVLGNIGRYAKKFGVDTSAIYRWTIADNREVYRLTKNMIEAMNTSTEPGGE